MKVLFFASLREKLNCAELEVLCPEHGLTVDELRHRLALERGENWRAALFQDNIICAVNLDVVQLDHPLREGDEVAFYPPVTGG